MIRRLALMTALCLGLTACDGGEKKQATEASPAAQEASKAPETAGQTAASGTEGGGEAPPSPAATDDGKAISTDAQVKTPSGLGYTVLQPAKAGSKEAKSGDSVSVHYTGWLTSGKKFDSSVDRGQPFEFQLGQGMVIRGWDEGVAGMKIGEKRKLVIPADLGYGERGAGNGEIPPNSTLIFEVELLGVR